MLNKLTPILDAKKEHIAARKRALSFADLQKMASTQAPCRGFVTALQTAKQAGTYGLIAEIKKASPSRGLIRADFDPTALAEAYQRGGAKCLSVLTDIPYFQGADEFIEAVKKAVSLPVLRKDFIIDPYQIIETRALGGDCLLLIMAALSDAQAAEFYACAIENGLDVLVEIHNRRELERALSLNPAMIGINNRDLTTLEVSIEISLRLVSALPASCLAVAESGLKSSGDLAKLAAAGITTFLVGESLMRTPDVERATRELLTG